MKSENGVDVWRNVKKAPNHVISFKKLYIYKIVSLSHDYKTGLVKQRNMEMLQFFPVSMFLHEVLILIVFQLIVILYQ